MFCAISPAPRCPECGRQFDPADVRTINLGREITPAARWALGPAGVMMSVGMLCAAGAAVWFVRLPVVEQDRSPIDAALLITLGAIWIGWPIVRYLIARWAGWNVAWFTAGQRSRFWVGAILVIIGIAISLHGPRAAAFWISRPAMDRLARQMTAVRGSSPADQWLGVIKAREIKDVPGGIRFMTTRDADGEAGFIYLPGADPKSAGWSSRWYVGGGWWLWHEPQQLAVRAWHRGKQS